MSLVVCPTSQILKKFNFVLIGEYMPGDNDSYFIAGSDIEAMPGLDNFLYILPGPGYSPLLVKNRHPDWTNSIIAGSHGLLNRLIFDEKYLEHYGGNWTTAQGKADSKTHNRPLNSGFQISRGRVKGQNESRNSQAKESHGANN